MEKIFNIFTSNYIYMKNILGLIVLTIMIASCGSTKEATVDTPPAVEEAPPAPQTMTRQFKKPNIDAEQLVAQLGLSIEQEKAFLEMWYKTSDAMVNVRQEHEGDRDALRSNMKAIRDERNAGLNSILTEAQLIKYYEIMDENRKKMGGAPIRRGGG